MKPARRAALWARCLAHEVACMALHAVAPVWHGAVAAELRKMADLHSRSAAVLRGMLRRET